MSWIPSLSSRILSAMNLFIGSRAHELMLNFVQPYLTASSQMGSSMSSVPARKRSKSRQGQRIRRKKGRDCEERTVEDKVVACRVADGLKLSEDVEPELGLLEVSECAREVSEAVSVCASISTTKGLTCRAGFRCRVHCIDPKSDVSTE